jgi:predicted nucleic acid-binding protein
MPGSGRSAVKTDVDLDGLERVYFDANALIYFVEGTEDFQDKVAELFRHLVKVGARLVTNEIAAAECLFGAYRSGRADLEIHYRNLLFETGAFEVAPVNFTLLDSAARTGAALGIKLIDATHVCAAISFECDALVTNDHRIRAGEALRIIRISDL